MKPIFVSRVFWSVAIIDFIVVFLMMFFTTEIDQIPIGRAISAYSKSPTSENARLVMEVSGSARRKSFRIAAYFATVIIFVTGGGMFVAYRRFRQRNASATQP